MSDKIAYAEAGMDAIEELGRARMKFPAFTNMHQGYAIILEELDEMWDEIKANNQVRAVEEAVQVAAMAISFIADFKEQA